MPRILISDDGRTRTYRITKDNGDELGFDYETVLTAEETREQTILTAARQSIDANRTYLALTSPTAAQNTAQIRALTRQVTGLLRITVRQFDATE